MERRQRRAAPYLRHERWRTLQLANGWRLRGVPPAYWLYTLSLPFFDATPVQQQQPPTNQPTLSYLILSYPILYPSPRNETSRSIQLASPFRSSVRWRACTYAARSHSRTPFAHTKHTSAQEQRTNAERTSERAGVGGEGGGTHKGRWLGSRVTHESHESARRGGGGREGGREEGRESSGDG